MRADVALFFTTTAMIAVVFLIVKNHTGSAAVIRETGDSLSSFYGTLITGNPAFFERRAK